MKDKNVAAEVLSRAIKTTIGDIGKINLTLQEKFSTNFNKIVDAYNERTDIADIEKIIEGDMCDEYIICKRVSVL